MPHLLGLLLSPFVHAEYKYIFRCFYLGFSVLIDPRFP